MKERVLEKFVMMEFVKGNLDSQEQVNDMVSLIQRKLGVSVENVMKVYIARDKDGRLFKYPYWTGMLATEIPHKHMCAYPFDGNHYIQGKDYQPKKGEEIDKGLYPEITYENSPILVEQN